MTERAEFPENRTLNLVFGLVFLGMAVVWWVLLFPSGVPTLTRDTTVLLLAIAAMAGFGLWSLTRLRKTAAVVVVDHDGLTDLRLMSDPIPWSELDRCDLVVGYRGVRRLRLVLRPGSPVAARLGRQEVIVNDLMLTGGARGVREAIARFAPQVPRGW
ncbi:hypothetical protein [Histidinibacterium lentulum]|uniref:PH domain-containing protein n=1 Tax=Histidinibacterium lentulum TaxID=2480588 RepID=A0A3N2R8M2_9RHOB|nr:hypothetical protein [Histidinibacterium lentulum]ROU03777.1 hypothetical protein EAT49_05645 [Histidinibacterium lentulum]